jgi:MFS transporter, UMF1 family
MPRETTAFRTLLTSKPVWGWAFYDWANSAFATTVLAGFFPIFFKSFWSVGVDQTVSTARLGIANSVAGITIALAAPVLGAIADRGISRKKFVLSFALFGSVMTLALYWIGQGHWLAAAGVFALAVIGFSGGNIFYDSLLTAVTEKRHFDLVSGFGYSLGYLGGGILFAFNVWVVLHPSAFGFADAAQATQFSFLTVGIWWIVFSIPCWILVRDEGSSSGVRLRKVIPQGLIQLKQTLRSVKQYKPVLLFLAAYWLYIDGVGTVIRMAIDYGLSIGFPSSQLITALLITQFVGFPSALLFGLIGKKFGAKQGLFICLAVYLVVVVWASLMRSASEFTVLAILIGFVQGGIQALSRSYYARLIPEDSPAEFFGFFNMTGKFAAIIGPVLMGGVGVWMASLGCSQECASRISIISISFLFITGGIVLGRVEEIPEPCDPDSEP